jgi:hypothetical protein
LQGHQTAEQKKKSSLCQNSGWHCRFAAVRAGSTGNITFEHFGHDLSSSLSFGAPNETEYDEQTLVITFLDDRKSTIYRLCPLHSVEFLYMDVCQHITENACRL